MATVNKDFRIKNGLVVEGSTATVNGSNVLTEASTEFLQDTAAAMLVNGTASGITFSYNDTDGVINATVSTTPTFADKIIFEGATADDYETTLQVVEPTADHTITLPNATTTLIGTDTTNTLTNKTFNTNGTGNTFQINGNTIDSYTGSGSQVMLSSSPSVSVGINFNGSTSGQTTLQASATASGTITLPAASGTLALTTDVPSGVVTESGTQTLTNKTLTSPNVNGNGIVFEGTTADEFETTLTVVDPTGDRTITLPNVTGTVVTSGDTGTVTNTMLAGSIANNKLENSSITINGFSIALGGSATYGTDNIDEGSTNKYFTDERAQDAIGSAISAGTQTGITVTYSDLSNKIDFSVADQWSGKTTSDLTEGTNLYFTNERVDDRLNDVLINGTGISKTYDDNGNTLTIANTGVVSLSGTANEVEVSNTGTSYTVGLPDNITVGGNITINGTPTNSNHAATVAYVDAATAGLNVHASVKAATTENINLSTDVENGDTLDGVTLATGNRILVKNQTTKTQNGVYVVAASGAPTRASDYDSTPEVDAGDFIFVEGGTVNGKTGWVQTNTIVTIGDDNIEFTQFSGAGTYQAGTGLSLTGNVFSINTATTVDVSTAQTLTNKTLTSPTISGLYLSDNNIVIEGNPDTNETTLIFTNPTEDRTITFPDASGTVAFTSDITSAINALSTTDIEEGSNLYFTDERAQDAVGLNVGTGLSYNDTTGAISNAGVTGITGTSNQVIASGSTGSVTLSLPQDIHTSATPTFAGIALTDALMGTAVQSLTDGTATVVDSWSVTSYRSAKYIVQLKKSDDIQVLEVLVTVDGNNNVYLTEYADVISNASIGTTDADYSSGNARLLVTASNGTTVKVHKTLIEA